MIGKLLCKIGQHKERMRISQHWYQGGEGYKVCLRCGEKYAQWYLRPETPHEEKP